MVVRSERQPSSLLPDNLALSCVVAPSCLRGTNAQCNVDGAAKVFAISGTTRHITMPRNGAIGGCESLVRPGIAQISPHNPFTVRTMFGLSMARAYERRYD